MQDQRTVYIVDDDAAVRASMAFFLPTVGYASRPFAGGGAFLAQVPTLAPGCVLLDIRMPDIDGAEVVRRLNLLEDRDWPVIVITGHGEVPMAVQMMKAGVIDFIEKPFDPNRLLDAVRGCLGHLQVLQSERASRATISRSLDALTPRERQVFECLVEGRSNKEIALSLAISPRTVEIFRAKVMTKLGVDNLSAVVRIGILHARPAVI